MHDTYTAKGDKKQPLYQITNDNWHIGDSTTATQGQGTGGVSKVTDDFDAQYIEKVRNNGFRFLDEPSNAVCEYDEANHSVKLKWKDPVDLTDDKPAKCIWAKTYVVRRESEKPVNIYQGTVIATSTTRDEYENDWFVDNTVQENKKYYYAIMPCDTKDDVRWTCCFGVNTYKFVLAPTITSIAMDSEDNTKVLANYTIPSATYDYIKLVYKKDAIPTSKDDGTAIDITQESTSQLISHINDGNTYWFVIFTDKTSSEPEFITTENTTKTITWKNAVAFPEDDEKISCYTYSWANKADCTVSGLKSSLASRGNTLILTYRTQGANAYCVHPYTLADNSSVYFGTKEYISSGANDELYGYSGPQSMDVFYGWGSSAGVTDNYSTSTTKDGVTYRVYGGDSTYPTYFITTAKNVTVYVDGVLKEVINEEE